MPTNIKKHEMLADDVALAKLYSNINVLDYKSCWIWNGTKVKDGYGFITKQVDGKRRTIFVHRLSWVNHYGEIPDDMVVDHTCHTVDIDNCIGECKHRACYNPYHLRVVTFSENLRVKRRNPHTQSNEETGLCHSKLHKWEEGSYTVFKSGKRSCNACRKATNARSMATAKAVAK